VKKISSIFEFYIKSSLHLSLSVLALILITSLRLSIEFDSIILFIVFNATIIVYNFIKYASTLPYYFLVNNISIKKIQYLSFFCGLCLFCSLFYIKIQTILFGIFMSIFCIIYVIPFNRSKRNIRNYSRIKIFIVAFCWAAVTVLFPLTVELEVDYLNAIILFFQRFIFVVVYTLPFEIRDLKFDSIELKTIPQLYGLKKTKQLAYLLLILFLLINLVIQPLSIIYLISDFTIALITARMIYITKENQAKHFASFWVESIPILWLLIIFLLKKSIG
jgi:4-hydroxybenzoate polyprenyltransferase